MGSRRVTVMLVAAAAIAATLGGAVSVAAGGAATDRQDVKLRYTTKRPGAITGTTFGLEVRDPNDPDARPPGLTEIVIRGPKGQRYDTAALPRCDATDDALESEGPAACPPETQIGAGEIVTDSGPGPFPRLHPNDVTVFNGDHQQIDVAETRDPPTIRAVGRAMIRGRKFDSKVPPFPEQAPPQDSLTVIRTIHLVTEARVGPGGPLMRTPPRCPKSRHWTSRITLTYTDGVVERERAQTPCIRGDRPER